MLPKNKGPTILKTAAFLPSYAFSSIVLLAVILFALFQEKLRQENLAMKAELDAERRAIEEQKNLAEVESLRTKVRSLSEQLSTSWKSALPDETP